LGRLNPQDPLQEIRIRAPGELLDPGARRGVSGRPRVEARRITNPTVKDREDRALSLALGLEPVGEPQVGGTDGRRGASAREGRVLDAREPPFRLVESRRRTRQETRWRV